MDRPPESQVFLRKGSGVRGATRSLRLAQAEVMEKKTPECEIEEDSPTASLLHTPAGTTAWCSPNCVLQGWEHLPSRNEIGIINISCKFTKRQGSLLLLTHKRAFLLS